jgi:hypothetical protein
MTTLTDADLDSHLVDLTTVSLEELRTLRTPDLVSALRRTYAAAAVNTGNELQQQKQ